MNEPMNLRNLDAGEPVTSRHTLHDLAAKPCECDAIRTPPCDSCWAKKRLQEKGERR